MKKLFYVGILSALLLAACGNNEEEQLREELSKLDKEELIEILKEQQAAKQTAAESQQESQEKTNEAVIAYPGEVLTIAGVDYVLTEVQTPQEISGYTSENGVYLAVTLTVTNNTKEPLDTNNGDFKLYSDGAYYENDATTSAYFDGGDFLFEKINPGMSLTASVVYEIPATLLEQGVVVEVMPNMFKKDEVGYLALSERK